MPCHERPKATHLRRIRRLGDAIPAHFGPLMKTTMEPASCRVSLLTPAQEKNAKNNADVFPMHSIGRFFTVKTIPRPIANLAPRSFVSSYFRKHDFTTLRSLARWF